MQKAVHTPFFINDRYYFLVEPLQSSAFVISEKEYDDLTKINNNYRHLSIQALIQEFSQSVSILKKQIKTHKKEISELMEHKITSLFPEYWEEVIEQKVKHVKKLEHSLLPPVEHAHLDLAQAKEVPVTNFIEFKGRVAHCIWHNDKNPSLHYYPRTNSVWCFSCNHGGDVIDVVQKLFNCSFQEALKRLS